MGDLEVLGALDLKETMGTHPDVRVQSGTEGLQGTTVLQDFQDQMKNQERPDFQDLEDSRAVKETQETRVHQENQVWWGPQEPGADPDLKAYKDQQDQMDRQDQ